jgi:hypothetical protein
VLYDKLNFNFIRDIAPVAGVIRYPNVMEVNPSFPARTVAEFIAYAKANPGKINTASAVIGTRNPHRDLCLSHIRLSDKISRLHPRLNSEKCSETADGVARESEGISLIRRTPARSP